MCVCVCVCVDIMEQLFSRDENPYEEALRTLYFRSNIYEHQFNIQLSME